MLELDNVHAAYGNIWALRGLSLTVKAGEIVTLIGANGAGKSTTLRTISGLLRPHHGTIHFQGERIDGLPPHVIVRMGISQVPEGRRIFTRLTVVENLQMGAFIHHDARTVRRNMERVFDIFPRLRERARQLGGTLSGGEQQMLAIGRALMAEPTMLLLDEPSMGLAPILVEEIFRILQEINAQGTAILLVEQNAHMALQIAQRGYVLQTGELALSGTAERLRQDESVRRAYLGGI